MTGGTGSLGSRFIDFLFNVGGIEPHKFVVFSRDEQKQYTMALKYKNAYKDSDRISFVLGDVRDQQSVMDAIDHFSPDVVLHTAAQKHVKICEHNPMQTVLTNVHGTKHVTRACINTKVPVACFISTDKAVFPTTLYGMTKHIAERVWQGASLKSQNITKFVGARYGNIINSKGSLIPLYKEIAERHCIGPVFPVTDAAMTRFFITFDQAVRLIIDAVSTQGINLLEDIPIEAPEIITTDRGVFRIPKLPAARIMDIAELFAAKYGGSVNIIGAFESEKLHEEMVIGHSSKDWVISSDEVKQLLEEEHLL